MIRTLQIFILLALPFISFLNSLNNSFVYDDVFTITDNYFIRNWNNLPAIFTNEYFKYSGEATYRPFVTLSYFIDYSVWQLNPFGYHLTNVILHIIAVLLVYLTTSSLIKNTTISYLTALLFSLHPVLTEAVNGISYREDLLTTCFFLCSLLLFILSSKHAYRYTLFYPVSLLAYFLALCSKEMAITLPFIIFLIDWIFNSVKKVKKNIISYYLGFLLVSAFYLFLRFIWFHHPAEQKIAYPGNSALVNLFTMPKVIVSYIKLLFYPITFNAEYIIAHTTAPLALNFIFSVLLLGVTGIIIYKLYSRAKSLFFFSLWFFITLTPAMNIIPIANIMAERYLYLPAVGFCFVLAYITYSTGKYMYGFILSSNVVIKTRHFRSYAPLSYVANTQTNSILRATSLIFFILIPIIPYSIYTINRNTCWNDQFTFWSATVETSPNSARAHNNLGMIYFQGGETDLAIHEFQQAVEIKSDPEYHHNLGMAYQNKGQRNKALHEYRLVLQANPNSAITHNNIGNILIDMGRIDEGILKFKKAIKLQPNYYDAHYNLGLAYFKKGLLDKSMEEFKRAIHYEPDHPEAHSCLGTVYANKGMFDKSIKEYEETLRLQPNYLTAYKNLGTIYLNHKKDVKKAVEYFRKYIKLNPDSNDAEQIIKTIKELQTYNE